MLYLFALAYGFAFGGIVPGMASLIGDTFGLRQIGSIMGALDVGVGVGAAIGPAVGGLIFDVSHSYFLAFLLGAAAMFAVTLFLALVRREADRNFGAAEARKCLV